MDQWDAEGQVVLIPATEGKLQWEDIWWPHNEHRIVWTKLLALGLTWINRQWDPVLEMGVNALLHTTLAILLLAWSRRFARPGLGQVLIAVCLALAFGLPHAWENTLQGFQSQFYFLALLTLLFLRTFLPAQTWSLRWWSGLLLGACTLGTMSSGFMAAAAALVTVISRAACERTLARRHLAAMLGLGAIIAFGLASFRHVPGHDVLRVASPGELWRELNGTFGWPTSGAFPVALVMQLPLAVFAWTRLRSRRLEGDEAVLFAFGAWCVMQTGVLAYARGHLGAAGSPRYADIFALGTIANAIALSRAWPGSADFWRRPLACAWVLLAAHGFSYQVGDWTFFRDELPEARAGEKPMLRRFMATGNIEVIRTTPSNAWPHPMPETLAEVLTHPGLKRLLPPSLRPAVPLRADEGTVGFDPPNLPIVEGIGEPDTPIWAAEGPARFISAPLPRDLLPILRFQIRASRNLDPNHFRLETERGERTPLAIPRFAGDRWQTAHLPLPDGEEEVRLVIELPSGSSLAFAAPIEVGRGSYLIRQAIKAGQTLWQTGGALLLAALLAFILKHPPEGGWLYSVRWCCGTISEHGRTYLDNLTRRLAGVDVRQLLLRARRSIGTWIEALRSRKRLAMALGWSAIGLALFLRKPDSLTNPQFWAEDGEVFLVGHFTQGFGAWLQPYAGYIHLLPRIVTAIACQFDPLWWPRITTLLTFGLWWIVIARCWSPRLEVPAKAWLPLPFFAATLTAEILYNVTNLQWITSFILVQQLFLRPPDTRLGRAAEIALLILVCLTGPFCLVLWPISTWATWRRPHHGHRIALWIAMTLCVAVQLWFIKHDPNPVPQPPLTLLGLLQIATAGGQRLLVLFFGRSLVEAMPPALWLAGFLGIGTVLAFLLYRTSERRLWFTAIAAFALLFAAGLYRSRLDQSPLDLIGFGDRYFFGPRVLLGWMLIWAAQASWKGRRAAQLLASFAVLAHLPTFVMAPYPDMEWARWCEPLRRGEAVEIQLLPNWILYFPARK